MSVMLSVRNIKKEFAQKQVLKDVSFDISVGERIGLVGANGAGKTTLVNILSKNLSYDSGSILWHKKSINIGYLKQDSASEKHNCSEENFKSFLQYSSNLGLEKVQEWKEEKFDNLSGGERTKVALSHVWSQNPDFLIFDEPTNHLDYDGVSYLIKELKKYKGTVLVISHDRYFLDECAERILEIDEGRVCSYGGNYSFYREEKKRRYESELKEYLLQEETKKKINEQIKMLKNWSAKAHRESRKKAIKLGGGKGGKEYFRLKAKKKDKQIKSRIKRLEKIEVEGVEKPKEEKKVDFDFKRAGLKGTRIIEAADIGKSFEDKILFKESSFYIQRGEKVGIFGKNGCGKTTLLKIILGKETLNEGEIFLSAGTKIGYISQDTKEIDMDKKVLDLFDISSKEERGSLQTILFNMGFDENMAEQKISTLSLGEITRLKIVKLITDDCSLLILDEPMNHLDIYSREKLEEVLQKYEGTIILVSHDRYMMQKICNKLLVFENQKIKRLEHTLKEYLESIQDIGSQKCKSSNQEEKMVIENEMAFILGELNKYPKESSEYAKLDRKFESLVLKKKAL